MPLPQLCYGGVRILDRPCLPNVRRVDLNCLPMIEEFHHNGILIDPAHLAQLAAHLRELEQGVAAKVEKEIGRRLNWNSPDAVSRLLFHELGLKPPGRVRRTDSGEISSADEVLTSVKEQHPVVPLIQEGRGLSKLRTTYAEKLPLMTWEDGRLHGAFKYTRTATGRLSMEEPNLQNIPIRTDLGNQVRGGFIAQDGCVLASLDFSQIEMLMAADLSGDEVMLQAFRDGKDIHTQTAARVYGLDAAYWDRLAILAKREDAGETVAWIQTEKAAWTLFKREKRLPCKTAGFAILYGQEAEGLRENIEVNGGPHWEVEEVRKLISGWFATYQGIQNWLELQHQRARRYSMVWDIVGRVRLMPGARSRIQRVVNEALREAGNMPIQCITPETLVVAYGQGLTKAGNVSNAAILWDGHEWASGRMVRTSKRQPCVGLTLYNGMVLRCGLGHRLLVRSPRGHEDWLTAEALRDRWAKCGPSGKHGLKIALMSDSCAEWRWGDALGFRKSINEWAPSRSTENAIRMDLSHRDMGIWLGRLASDGGVFCDSRNGTPKVCQFLVAEHEADVLILLKRLCGLVSEHVRVSEYRFERPGSVNRSQKVWSVRQYSRGLATAVAGLDIKNRIPPFVWDSSELLSGYLSGLFDGDGGVGADGVVLTFGGGWRRLVLAAEVQQALAMLGIRSRVRRYAGYQHNDKGRVVVQIQKADTPLWVERVDFLGTEKRNRAWSVRPSRQGAARPVYGHAVAVREFVDCGDQEMVDFVNSSTGRFAVAGMVTHNSSAQALIKLAMSWGTELVRWFRDCYPSAIVKPLLQIHDELIFELSTDVAEEFCGLMRAVMENVAVLAAPIGSSSVTGHSWDQLKG